MSKSDGKRRSRVLAVAAFLPLLGFAFLFWLLVQPGAATRDEPFFQVPFLETDVLEIVERNVPLAMEGAEAADGTKVFRVELESSAGDVLVSSSAISLAVATYLDSGTVVSGELILIDPAGGGKTARYVAPAGQSARDAQSIRFERDSGPSEGIVASAQRVSITLQLKGVANLALWTYQTKDAPFASSLWTSTPDGGAFQSIFGGREIPATERAFSHAELISYVWGFPTGGAEGVFRAVFAAMALWLVGTFLVWRRACGRIAGWVGPSLGAGFLFLSIGLVYAVVTPPFQVADEPDHFLTMSLLIGRGHLDAGALLLAKRAHTERIRMHSDQRFSSADVGQPWKDGWGPDIAPTIASRSALANVVWTAVGGMLNRMDSNLALLGARLASVVFVSFCVAASFAIFLAGAPAGTLTWLNLIPFLGVPSVVFLSAACSNYSFLIGACIVQCGAMAAILLSRADSVGKLPWVAAGASSMLALASSDNGIFYLGFWGLFLCLRALSGLAKGVRGAAETGLWYVAGLAGAALCMHFLTGGAELLPVMAADLVAGTQPIFGGSETLTLVALALVVAAGFVLGPSVAAWIGTAVRPGAVRPLRWATAAVALAVSGFVLLAPTLEIPAIQSTRITPGLLEYCGICFYALVEGFGPGGGDVYVTRSFWGVIGWLDTAVPAPVSALLRHGCAVGLALLVGLGWMRGGLREAVTTLVALAVLFLALAVACYLIDYNLHGRYLVGFYLLLATVSVEGFRRCLTSLKCPEGAVFPACLLLVMSFQTSNWAAMMWRYF